MEQDFIREYIRKVAEALNGMQVSDQNLINQSTELISKFLHKEGPLPLAFLMISVDSTVRRCHNSVVSS